MSGEQRLPVRHRTDSPWRTCPSRQLAEKLFARLQSKWPCRPLWRVAGKLPLPRRGGFQSALLVGELETAAPCVAASRLTHVSQLIATLRSRRRSGSRPGRRSLSRCRCRRSCRCGRGCWCRTRCSCGRGCWCRSRCGSRRGCRCGSRRCWHHRIRMSLAIVNTSAYDDAIVANAQGRRGGVHR
jgi:hypothetical protein